jgi:hypothetical protein
VLAALAMCGAGCGGGGGGDAPAGASATVAPPPSVTPGETPTATATASPPVARAKDAPSPPPDAPTATPTTPEDAPGGAGDEKAARVPVKLTVQPDGQLVPATVSVPAFLALELTIRNRTPAPVTVTMEHVPGALDVEPGATATERLDGLPKGRYEVAARGAGTATVIAGVEPGP